MLNSATISGRKLLFGTFAARRFCTLAGCENVPSTILNQLLNTSTRQDALLYIVWSGLQAAMATDRVPFNLDEADVCAIYDSATEVEGEAIANAFIGSIVGKSADEVPAYLESLRVAVEKEMADQLAETSDRPNPAAPLSPTGSALNNGDTVTG